MSLAYDNHSHIIVILVLDPAVHNQEVPCPATAASHAPSLSIVTGYKNQSQMISSAGAENQGGASLTNYDHAVFPDDYTLQNWQKVNPFKDIRTQNFPRSEFFEL